MINGTSTFSKAFRRLNIKVLLIFTLAGVQTQHKKSMFKKEHGWGRQCNSFPKHTELRIEGTLVFVHRGVLEYQSDYIQADQVQGEPAQAILCHF